jgi:hypothetical protein
MGTSSFRRKLDLSHEARASFLGSIDIERFRLQLNQVPLFIESPILFW